MKIDNKLKKQALNTLERQVSKMNRSSKLVILNIIGVSKETMVDMSESELVSRFLELYADYLMTLDMDNVKVDPDYFKVSLFISGHNKTELETLIKNY